MIPSAGGVAQQAGIGTLGPLLKVHGCGLMEIASLSDQQRLAAALATMKGDGLQGHAAEEQNRRATEGQGQGKAAAAGLNQGHRRSTNAGRSIPRWRVKPTCRSQASIYTCLIHHPRA